jgi:hypothetical protein
MNIGWIWTGNLRPLLVVAGQRILRQDIRVTVVSSANQWSAR